MNDVMIFISIILFALLLYLRRRLKDPAKIRLVKFATVFWMIVLALYCLYVALPVLLRFYLS